METTPDTYVGLFIGYSVIWCIIGLYLFFLLRRVKKLEEIVTKKVSKSEE